VKLLIYSPAFWPQVGGVESVGLTLASGLAHHAIEVTVVTRTPPGPASDSNLPFRMVRRPSLTQLLTLMRDSDLLHLAGPAMLPLAIGILTGKPLVLEHHGFQAVCPNGQLFYESDRATCSGHFMAGRHQQCWRCNAGAGRWNSLRMWALTFPRRWLLHLVKANVAPTHALEKVLRLPRTFVIWHGVGEPTTELHAASQQTARFVYVGRLVSTKGVHLLLDAAHQLQKRGLVFRIQIIGDGPERERLEAQAQRLGLQDNVQFLGYLPEAAAVDVANAALAVVMPSLAGEVFGLVAAENMMRGCLMVVPDEGALAEVVGDAGIKFKSGDVVDLAGQLEALLRFPQKATALRQSAMLRSREFFNKERMVAAHLELYRNMLR
jgi:glycogen synthase